MIYCGIAFIREYYCDKIGGGKIDFKTYLKWQKIYLAIMCTWIVALIFEISGGRAANISSESTISFRTSISQLYALVQAIAVPFLIIAIK